MAKKQAKKQTAAKKNGKATDINQTDATPLEILLSKA